VPVFGILERRGRVSVTVVPNVTAQTLLQETVTIVKRGTFQLLLDALTKPVPDV